MRDGPCINTDVRDPIADELHLMKTCGIIEIMVRNPNVADWVEHWEGRALKAEAKVRDLTGEDLR